MGNKLNAISCALATVAGVFFFSGLVILSK